MVTCLGIACICLHLLLQMLWVVPRGQGQFAIRELCWGRGLIWKRTYANIYGSLALGSRPTHPFFPDGHPLGRCSPERFNSGPASYRNALIYICIRLVLWTPGRHEPESQSMRSGWGDLARRFQIHPKSMFPKPTILTALVFTACTL